MWFFFLFSNQEVLIREDAKILICLMMILCTLYDNCLFLKQYHEMYLLILENRNLQTKA